MIKLSREYPAWPNGNLGLAAVLSGTGNLQRVWLVAFILH